MFNRGITQLLAQLPEFEGLDGDSVKRLLTSAYLEGLDLATLAGEDRRQPLAAQLRRLVTALEVHAILVPGVEEQARRACAFVAAESLNLLADLGDPVAGTGADEQFFAAFGSRERYRRIEAALLYRIAAFDANAAIVARNVIELPISDGFETEQEGVTCEWALRQIIAFIRLLPAPSADAEPPAAPEVDAAEQLVSRIRTALWRRIGEICRDHLRWLRLEDDTPHSSTVEQLGGLAVGVDRGRGAGGRNRCPQRKRLVAGGLRMRGDLRRGGSILALIAGAPLLKDGSDRQMEVGSLSGQEILICDLAEQCVAKGEHPRGIGGDHVCVDCLP